MFDFEIRSPELNSNALIDTWPRIKGDIFCLLSIAEREQCSSFYDSEIGHFIALMKLLSQKTKFEERVVQLLIFSNVSNCQDILWRVLNSLCNNEIIRFSE